MKVGELIELLLKQDENSDVVISADGITHGDAEKVEYNGEDVVVSGDYRDVF